MERGSVARNTRAEARCSNDVSHDAICVNGARGIETSFAPEREGLNSEDGEVDDLHGRGTKASEEETSGANNNWIQHDVQL